MSAPAAPSYADSPPPGGGRVLVGALDWGLGHAARSCALVRRYHDREWRVLLASAGAAGRLLRAEFPELPYYDLPAYAVRYPGRNMYLNIARQLPQLLGAAYREYRWLRRFCRRESLDLIISDSRFGLRHPAIPSVLLTHQTEPILHPVAASLALPVYRAVLRQFSAVWVPDYRGPERLSGRLSDPTHYRQVRYIGPLSRFSAYAERTTPPAAWDSVTLLSGPEPQRTRLEAELLPQLQAAAGRHLLIRGVPGSTPPPVPTGGGLHILPFCYGEELAATLAAARLVICRSGYSTLLDLRALGKPALLIPTPGQTEQEYLAGRAAGQGWAAVQEQGQVKLSAVLPNGSPAAG